MNVANLGLFINDSIILVQYLDLSIAGSNNEVDQQVLEKDLRNSSNPGGAEWKKYFGASKARAERKGNARNLSVHHFRQGEAK